QGSPVARARATARAATSAAAPRANVRLRRWPRSTRLSAAARALVGTSDVPVAARHRRRNLVDGHAAIAGLVAAGLGDGRAQAEDHDAADRIAALALCVDDVRVERLEHALVLEVEEERTVEPVLLVAGVNGEVGRQVELLEASPRAAVAL